MLHCGSYCIHPEEDASHGSAFKWLKEEHGKNKLVSFFDIFIQKKNIGLTHMFDRGYILWSL